MLGRPMAIVLERCALDPVVSDALLHRSGKFGNMSSLVVSCESDDERAVCHSVCAHSIHQIDFAQVQALAASAGETAPPQLAVGCDRPAHI